MIHPSPQARAAPVSALPPSNQQPTKNQEKNGQETKVREQVKEHISSCQSGNIPLYIDKELEEQKQQIHSTNDREEQQFAMRCVQ